MHNKHIKFLPLDSKDLILERIKKGDSQAFKILYSEYYEKLCVYLMRYTSDKDKVEDTVQDVFTRLWNKRKEISIRSSLKNFLYRAAYNELMDNYRKQKRKDEMLSSYYHNALMQAIEVDPALKAEKIKKLKECIEALPSKCKAVFIESKISRLRHFQVAEKLNISMKTVEGHITRGFAMIKACMGLGRQAY